MVTSRRRRAVVTAVVVGLGALVPITADHASAAETGTVYVVQGVADTPMTITVDGKAVATAAAAKTIVGPLTLPVGSHTVAAESPSRTETVSASISVTAGSNVDAVLHRQVDPSKPPVITTFPNDLSPVTAGSGRLVVAHTAAVGPADVRVDQKVLFANIANGEALTVTVPASTYSVDIVPSHHVGTRGLRARQRAGRSDGADAGLRHRRGGDQLHGRGRPGAPAVGPGRGHHAEHGQRR